MSGPALQIVGLTRRFGALVAVHQVSFDVAAGEICGFIGPNGAGKTTTMRIAATLDLPDEGDVLIGGQSVLSEPRAARLALGFMPDALEMEAWTPVSEFLDFYARAYGLHGKLRRARMDDAIAFTGLGPLLDKECASLSKGNAQRLLLAKTLLHDPAVLLLDEPAAGLDPRARVELRELVKALATLGKAVLLSSHILTELAEMCHTVAILEQGRLMAKGPVSDIVATLSPARGVFLRALCSPERLERFLIEQPHVIGVRPERDGLVADLNGGDAEAAALLDALVRSGLQPVVVAPASRGLEEVFLHLTEGRLQ